MTQSPALVCDRAAAGSDPVQTSLPLVRARFASAFHVSFSASQPVNPSVPLQGQVRSLPDDVERDPREMTFFLSFTGCQNVYYLDIDFCTLTSIFLCFFLLSSACPQTDTAQLNNTQPAFRARTSGSNRP